MALPRLSDHGRRQARSHMACGCIAQYVQILSTNQASLTNYQVHSLVNPLFDAGREVVIIGHSYGGIPACASTQGYTMDERADKGKKGGFRSIIYLAGFAIPEKGKDLLQTIGGSWAPWQDPAIPDSEVNSRADFLQNTLN